MVQVFHDIAYKAKDRQDLLAGIEEFLDEVIVLPPGEWDPDIRIEPPKSLPSADKRWGFTFHLGSTGGGVSSFTGILSYWYYYLCIKRFCLYRMQSLFWE